MKKKLLYPMFLIAGFMLSSFSVSQVYAQTALQEPVKKQSEKYTCPMHAEVVQDLPGKCPKCGMALVEKKALMKKDMHQSKDSTLLKKDPVKRDSTAMKHDHMGI
jgi:hypothetical protein